MPEATAETNEGLEACVLIANLFAEVNHEDGPVAHASGMETLRTPAIISTALPYLQLLMNTQLR